MRPTLMLALGSLTSLMFACNAATEADLRSLANDLLHGGGNGHGPAEPSCPIIAICQICDDGSCATATTPAGSCSPVTWVCPESPSEPSPGACASVYDPVCGIDGVTYGNACEADLAGTEVVSSGECADGGAPEPPLCAVPSICLTCPDDTCAQAVFDENTCDNARWLCADGSEIDF